MKISKFGWLAAVIALAAVVGAVAYTPHTTEAAVTGAAKACAATPAGQPVNTSPCNLTFAATPPDNAGGATFTVSLAGPAVLTAAGPITTTGCTGTPTLTPGPTTIIGGVATFTTFTITNPPAGCLAGTVYTVPETLLLTAAGGVTQTVVGNASGTVSVAAATGLPVFVPVAPPTAAVTAFTFLGCTASALPTAAVPAPAPPVFAAATVVTTIVPGQSVTCRFDLNDNELATVAVAGVCGAAGLPTCASLVSSGIVQANLAGLAGGITATLTGSAGSGPATLTGNTASLRCGAGPAAAANPQGCDFVDLSFTSAQTILVAALPAALGVNLTYTPDIPTQNTSAQISTNPVITIVQVVQALVGPAAIGIVCLSSTGATGAFGAFGGIGPGFVTTFPAITVGTAAAPGTQFATVFGATTGLGAGGNIGTAFGLGFSGIGTVPGQAGNLALAAVGVLPESIACRAVPLNAAGQAIAVAPGTMEVTSLNGGLLDASGNLTTNLRIGCGSGLAVGSTAALGFPIGGGFINFNDCVGVGFAVAPTGVGIVDIRVRYEPNTAGSIVGINEAEGVSSVGFVAPASNISLLLNPNPVTAGAPCNPPAVGGAASGATSCGTAEARFNRVLFTAGTATIINPTTGNPVFLNLGTVLNGNVVFTIENSAIARFVAGAPGTSVANIQTGVGQGASGLPTSVGGFTVTANQSIVRCGFFATGANPAVANVVNFGTLGGFFGGCDTAATIYQGIVPGVTNLTATFVPDLPGAFGSAFGFGGTGAGVSGPFGVGGTFGGSSVGALLGSFAGAINSSAIRAIEVVGAAPSGRIDLARGCNNITPTVTESTTAYGARVSPSNALLSIFEFVTAENRFRGAPGPAAPASAAAVADLNGVTRLRPVFLCVNAPATLDQPAA